jgi:hypothetical protein
MATNKHLSTVATGFAVLALAGALAPAQELDGRAPRQPSTHRPTIAAAFPRESYAPGQLARLVVYSRARNAVVRLFHAGTERTRIAANDDMRGTQVGSTRRFRRLRAGSIVRLEIGDWPSGLYYARLDAAGGKVGFAPFVLRPKRLGEHRVAVVLPTQTWQAYNFSDDDGDGDEDTWYAGGSTARTGRPYENRGVPTHYKYYDQPFLCWLSETGRDTDYLAQADLNNLRAGRVLADAYELIVFPGHHEYVTAREYDVVERYRDLGGNLMFLSANNFFYKVTRRGNVMTRVGRWRDVGRPEAALVGVQYVKNDEGEHRGAWIMRPAGAAHWAFAGTGTSPGSQFSNAGIEIDKTSPSSPRGTKVLAEIPDLLGPRLTAQMTYYEHPSGAKVFAAGAFTLAGSVRQPPVRRLLSNLWDRFAEDRTAVGFFTHDEALEGKQPRLQPSKRPSVLASFPRESYQAGETARLVIRTAARAVTVQLFRAGVENTVIVANDVMLGRAVSKPLRLRSTRVGTVVDLPISRWPSGLYFARLTARGGRVGHAPFVLRPARLGSSRIAVVLPTETWQAYNFSDDDGDGDEDTWYSGGKVAFTGRPFENRGVPTHYKSYDQPFLRWLASTGRRVDYLAQADLNRLRGGRALADAYDLIVFPGHHEYVTEHEYDAIQEYRDRGGNLMFLSANNFFWKIERRGDRMTRIQQWRRLGRPEAALIGVQYFANDNGSHRRPWVVHDPGAAHGLMSSAGLHVGSELGVAGIEVDGVAPASPRGTTVLAEVAWRHGKTAEMTYYETPAGAKVFAAGAFTLAGEAMDAGVRPLLERLWARLAAR